MELSLRHREWGFNCPAVDLDFLVVEYNFGKPVAIVEYKFYLARKPELKHPTYRALHALSDAAGVPFLIAQYWKDPWAFRVTPVNDRAKAIYKHGTVLSERRYVESLYLIRKMKADDEIAKLRVTLSETLPPAEEIAKAA